MYTVSYLFKYVFTLYESYLYHQIKLKCVSVIRTSKVCERQKWADG